MSSYLEMFGRRITRFVESPVTILVKGIVLLVIGFTDASKTLTDDLKHGQFRVGHGLIIIGAFGVLGTVPHLIDGLAAGVLFRKYRLNQRRSHFGPGKSKG